MMIIMTTLMMILMTILMMIPMTILTLFLRALPLTSPHRSAHFQFVPETPNPSEGRHSSHYPHVLSTLNTSLYAKGGLWLRFFGIMA